VGLHIINNIKQRVNEKSDSNPAAQSLMLALKEIALFVPDMDERVHVTNLRKARQRVGHFRTSQLLAECGLRLNNSVDYG
jgi:hypothetical protein